MTDLEKNEIRQIIREELTMFFAQQYSVPFPVGIDAPGFVGAIPGSSQMKFAAVTPDNSLCQHVWHSMGTHLRCSKCSTTAYPGVTQGQ